MESSLEFIFYGLAAVLLLAFVLDVFSRFSSKPRPERFELEQRREAPAEGLAEQPPAAEIKAATPTVAAPVEAPKSLFERVKDGLHRTRANFTDSLAGLFTGRKSIDKELLEEVETLLLTADVGMAATTQIIDNITAQLERNQLKDPAALQQALREELSKILSPSVLPLEISSDRQPFVILMVGVNGVGKT